MNDMPALQKTARCAFPWQMRYSRKKQSGFSFIELLLSLGVITVLGFTVLQSEIERSEKEVADAFGTSVALYSQAVASYIADEGTAMPSGTFNGFDWLKSSGCGGSAPEDYVPCSWNPRLPFNIALETEVAYGTGVIGDPCSEPIGHVCAETRLTVPATNGQERLDLAAEMLHATQGSSNSIRATQQRFSLNDAGQIQVTAVGTQAPPTQFLRVDGVNDMDGTLNMGDAVTPHNLVDVGDLTAEGEVEMARFVDRDNPAFIMDPNAQSILRSLDARGDFAAAAGGNLNAQSVFDAGADIESAATFAGEANFRDLAKFIGGETDFNATVESSGGTAAQFNEADSQDLADFHQELELVGTGVVGGACDATKENMRFNSAGELMECVGGLWQYAGIETRKGTITYYSLDSTNSYGEFFWAGDGIDLPGKHHVCSAQSIESSNLAEGGGARIESTSGPDQFGRRSFQYLAAAGVRDANDIPLQLQSGERTVICLALGPEPVQATVGTQTNTAPTGSVSCTSGMAGEPFLSYLNVSDVDDPLLYSWSTSGRCSIIHANESQAWIQRANGSGTCTVRVLVTDYYNASRTISSSCQVTSPPPATVDGVCGCAALSCSSGTVDDQTPSEPPGWDSRPPPDGDGPWDPPHEWYCDGRNGGGWDYCVEGSSCPSPVSGNCSGTINRCSSGNAGSLTTIREDDQTTYRWTCRGIAGGSNDSCEVINTHTRPCNTSTDRVNGACGTNFGDCTAGTYEFASNLSWICRGACGGTDDECDSPNSNREDGACGPTRNNCAQGSYQSVSGPTWDCLGVNGGSNATGCAVIEHGVCGSSQGTCYQGTSSGNTNPWTCQGANGGADATCIFGECGVSNTTCAAGTPVNITGSHRWRCRGNNTGSSSDDVFCEVGLCGPAQGACDQGTSSGNTNPWDCEGSVSGSFGDDDVGCVVGECGTADNSTNGCMQGTWEHVDDTATDVLWRCLDDYHDNTVTTDDADCTLGLPMCDDVQGQCDVGTHSGYSNPWQCSGAGETKDCVIGECLFTAADDIGLCDTGVSTDDTGASNPWTCEGSVMASTADDETCEQAVCGLADNATEGCIVGTYRDVTGPRWDCVSPDHGTDNDVLNCAAPPATQCDIVQGDCAVGLSTNPSGSSRTWTCEGQHPDPNVTSDDEDCTVPVCEDAQGVCEFGTTSGNSNPWTCTGLGNGLDTFARPCSIGVCDYSGPGLCLQGTVVGAGHEWECKGGDDLSGTDDVDCIKAQCNPTGSDNDIEACITGIRSDLTDLADGTARWMCEGNDQNRTDDDAGPCMPGPTDGVCDFIRQPNGEPETGQCNEGQWSGLNNPWTCEGVNGGADTSCLMGHCGKAQDVCIAGTFQDASGDRWDCLGGDNATEDDDDLVCEDTEIPGKCEWQGPDDVGNCAVGTSTGQVSPWMCQGNNDQSTGDDVDCIQGLCGTADDPTPGVGCLAGTHNDVPGDTWDCLGNHPIASIISDDALGCTADECVLCSLLFPDLLTGFASVIEAGYPSIYGCETAQTDLDYNETLFESRVQQCNEPVSGVCGTSVGECDDGDPADVDTGAGTWTCEGENGGTDASCGTSCHSCSSQVDFYDDGVWHEIGDVHPNFRTLILNPESGGYEHPEYFWDYQYPSGYTCEQAENHWFDAWDNADTTFQTNASQCESLSCQDVFGDNRLVGAFPDCECPSGYKWTLDGTSITGGVCTPIIDGYCLSENWSVGYGEFCQSGTYVNTPEPGWICQGESGGTDASCGNTCQGSLWGGDFPPTNDTPGVSGCCFLSVFNQCLSGTFEDVEDDDAYCAPAPPDGQSCYTYWHCRGPDDTTGSDDHRYCSLQSVF